MYVLICSIFLPISIAWVLSLCIGQRFFSYRPKLRIPFYCLLIIGLSMVFWGYTSIKKRIKMQQWPKVEGLITRSLIQGIKQPVGIEPKLEEGRTLPRVEYTYSIEGKEYQGISHVNAPGFGPSNTQMQTANKLLKFWHKDKVIQVWYNPENPAESHLIPGPTWVMFVRLSFGMILITFACLYLFTSQKRQKETSNKI